MTSKTRFSTRVQCRNNKCRTRDRIKKRLEEYKREKRCVVCGGPLRSIEAERRRELAKQETCYCGPIPFPHREGSLRFCEHHPLVDVEPTDEEWEDYEGMCMTPRSG